MTGLRAACESVQGCKFPRCECSLLEDQLPRPVAAPPPAYLIEPGTFTSAALYAKCAQLEADVQHELAGGVVAFGTPRLSDGRAVDYGTMLELFGAIHLLRETVDAYRADLSLAEAALHAERNAAKQSTD